MKIDALKDSLEARGGISRTFQFVLFVSLLVNLFLVIGVAGLAYRSTKTILVPPTITKTFWVDGENIDPVYLEQMTTYVIQLFASYTPTSIAYQNSVLLTLVDPKAFPDLSLAMKQNELRVKGQNLTQVFYPIEIQMDTKKNSAVLIGTQKRFIGEKSLGGAERKAYLVRYGSHLGRATVVALRDTNLLHPFQDQADVEDSQDTDFTVAEPVTGTSVTHERVQDFPADLPPPPPRSSETDAQVQSLRSGNIPTNSQGTGQ